MHASHFNFKRAPSAPAGQSVGASPWTYTNSSKTFQTLAVSGGTVSLIEMNKGAGFSTQSGVSGAYSLAPSAQLRITYSVAPTVNMVQL